MQSARSHGKLYDGAERGVAISFCMCADAALILRLLLLRVWCDVVSCKLHKHDLQSLLRRHGNVNGVMIRLKTCPNVLLMVSHTGPMLPGSAFLLAEFL